MLTETPETQKIAPAPQHLFCGFCQAFQTHNYLWDNYRRQAVYQCSVCRSMLLVQLPMMKKIVTPPSRFSLMCPQGFYRNLDFWEYRRIGS